MIRYHPYTIFPLGDSALTIEFGNIIDADINTKVLELFHTLQKIRHPAITDLVPAFSSLTIFYDVAVLHGQNQTAFEAMVYIVEKAAASSPVEMSLTPTQFDIPVCYSEKFGWDIPEICVAKNLSPRDLIQIHTATTYRVYMLGFLPGFTYMGEVDERIAIGRKSSPRSKVFAGAVGIAGRQTGIYPLASPGGWQIIGRTPITVFDSQAAQPVLFAPGDQVRFFSITEDEFENYQAGHT